MPKSIISKLLRKGIYLIPYIVLAIVTVPILGVAVTEISKLAGIKTIPVPVVGTGSMYPSLFWAKSEGGPEDDDNVVIEEYRSTPHMYRKFAGINLFGKKYLIRQIGLGDMVAFKNTRTTEILANEGKNTDSGFVKRVIGLPGNTIELRDGFVYRDGQLISEPYITHPRSTYGGEFLKDCQKLLIPAGKYFVLGDNRKVSSDSRFVLGLVDEQDIGYVLPLNEQKIYHSLWRDTSKDSDSLGEPTLVSSEFLSLINELRSSKKLSKLSTVSTLNKSSYNRGVQLLKNPKTNYDMKKAISDSGYTNIILGEFISYGHFSAKELLENLLFNTPSAKQILNSEFSDIGVTAVNLEIDGCPSQIIVGHLGGYVPASYDQSTIDSWKALRDNISSALPSWELAVGHDQIDQSKLSSLLSIFYRRLELAREIVSTMEQKKWLTESQESRIKSDESDATQATILVKELNKE